MDTLSSLRAILFFMSNLKITKAFLIVFRPGEFDLKQKLHLISGDFVLYLNETCQYKNEGNATVIWHRLLTKHGIVEIDCAQTSAVYE